MRELTLEDLYAFVVDLQTEANNANHSVTSLYAVNKQQQLRIEALEDKAEATYESIELIIKYMN
jgi:hypothetical protein